MTTPEWMDSPGSTINGWRNAGSHPADDDEILMRNQAEPRTVIGLQRRGSEGALRMVIYRDMGNHLHHLLQHDIMDESPPEAITDFALNWILHWRRE